MNNFDNVIYSFVNKEEKILSVDPLGNGHINATYLVVTDKNKYCLQKINTNIFKDVDGLMSNIDSVTSHIREKAISAGKNPIKATLNFISSESGKKYANVDGAFYRMYYFVDEAFTIEQMENPVHFYYSGKAFGEFAKMLMDFDASRLVETIKNFHNTASRYLDFEKAVSDDIAKRAEGVKDEIEFVRKRKDLTSLLVDKLANGELPLRVTHNDTKINNVLFDINTVKPVTVIDLDTVMPGSYLYDFGDAIRSGATHAAEDEKDLSKVDFDLELYENFAKGYIEESKNSLTEKEIEMLPYASVVLTFECGMRFLTDHLNGDTYFRIHRENHNLDRCRTQFRLVELMMENIDKLKEIINRLAK